MLQIGPEDSYPQNTQLNNYVFYGYTVSSNHMIEHGPNPQYGFSLNYVHLCSIVWQNQTITNLQ